MLLCPSPSSGIIGVRHCARLMQWWEQTQGFWHGKQTLPTNIPVLISQTAQWGVCTQTGEQIPRRSLLLTEPFITFICTFHTTETARPQGTQAPSAQGPSKPFIHTGRHTLPCHRLVSMPQNSHHPSPARQPRINQEDGPFGQEGFAGPP